MDRQVFVAREQELAQLHTFLSRALEAQGRACFVIGQAGSGKTTLVTEFARQAQEMYPDLAVAVGQSDAHTGIGDAHLPFREVLGQLTGDVDSKLAQGAISAENAGRLRKLLALSGQALVDLGPDLIGVFLPGAGLATRAGAFVAEKAGWLNKLDGLATKKSEAASAGIEQSHIFEQYANVLCKLSEKHPLLIVLDDLQWADEASIGLLFRLARRVQPHRILILGTYRPEEVALGRDGRRHPLEKVLAELKRYYGDIFVDLEQAEECEGRAFVNKLLDTEPNRLGEEFRQKLYQHTGGHPLFTIELLRSLQERGDLVRDEQDRWVQTPELAWESMPERVEGVIEERIGRLEEEMHEMLSIGSVEGEDFTAEVIARLRSADVRTQVRRLSAELERQHRLVSAKGMRRLGPNGQRLSQYRFQHNLFRAYLYGELDEIERAYLHEEVGTVLEELFGGLVDEILVQLAAHFDQAGNVDKALHYLQRAGDQAADRFANTEAARYFSRALDLMPEADQLASQPEQLARRFELLLARENILARMGEREAQQQDLEALCRLVEILNDEARRAKVSLREARFAEMMGDYPAALAVLEEAIQAARRAEDIPQEARALKGMGYILWRKGDYKESGQCSQEALSLARRAGLKEVETGALHNLAVVHWRLGELDKARSFGKKCLDLSRSIGDRRALGTAFSVLGNIELQHGELKTAKKYYEKCLRNDEEMGERRGQAMARGNLGIVAEMQGDFSSAMENFRQVGSIFHEMGDLNSEARALGHMGLNANLQGDYEHGRASLEAALKIYRQIEDRQGQVWIQTMLCRLLDTIGAYPQAARHIKEALKLSQEIGVQNMEAIAWTALARLYEKDGALEQAAGAYLKGLRIHRQTGDETELVGDLAGLARVALAKRDHVRAEKLVEQILSYAQQKPIQGTADEPLEIYLTCYRVLQTLGDPRADQVLTEAHQMLQEQAARISDPSLRRSYLENVPPHREILREIAAIG
jgi:tetratricopeptide (TPR) repeat protein